MRAGHDVVSLRRRLRRERACKLWAERLAYTLGYALMTAATIVLLWLYGP